MTTETDNRFATFSACLTGLVAMACLVWWLSYDPTADLVIQVPGMDGRPKNAAKPVSSEIITIGEFEQAFDGVAATLPGAWPRFRGPGFDNIDSNSASLADSWPESGPKILWSVKLGEGHAAPAVMNGRVYLLDYDEEKKGDALRCFSLADGKEIWRRWYHVRVKRNHGMSRTIPAVTDKYVLTMGPRGHVMCVEATTGDFLWGKDLEREYGTEIPFWYTGQCPLIEDGVAVIAPGGKALMFGADCATGEILWETPNPDGWQMSHSSVMPVTLLGKRMYVYCATGGIVGVSAEDADRGELLWASSIWSPSVVAASPVVLDDARLFVTAGYGAGSMVLQVSEKNGGYSVEKLLKYKPDMGMASEQQTPILYQGHLFTIQPKDAGVLRKQLACYHPDDVTKPVWTSGKTNRFGLGPYLIADDKMFVLNDDGVLTLIAASTAGYKQWAQAKVLDGPDAWGPLALAANRLLLRDAHRMVCLDVGAE